MKKSQLRQIIKEEIRNVLKEAAWFTNLRKEEGKWLMDVDGKPTEMDKRLNIKGDKVKLYFLRDKPDPNSSVNMEDYGKYFALEQDAKKNGKGYGSWLEVGVKEIPMKDLKVSGRTGRMLIFEPKKRGDKPGIDISKGRYKKV